MMYKPALNHNTDLRKDVREPDEELDPLAHQTLGACIEVHRGLGPGYLESVYEAALAVELTSRSITHHRQYPIAVTYKEHRVGEGKLDFLIADRLVVELKSVESLLPIHAAQVISYLKTTGCKLGLLINFNQHKLADGIKRIVLSE